MLNAYTVEDLKMIVIDRSYKNLDRHSLSFKMLNDIYWHQFK